LVVDNDDDVVDDDDNNVKCKSNQIQLYNYKQKTEV